MAADIGIKIDAVFSLVGPDDIIEDIDHGPREEDIDVDICASEDTQNDLKPEVTVDVASGTAIHDESTDSSSSVEKYEVEDPTTSPSFPFSMYTDFDAPPPLFMESNGPPTIGNHMLAPPVLEPEEPIVEEPPRLHADLRSIPRKRCIAPSYIVLTDVQSFLKGKHKVGYRQLKRSFKECLNICKKVHFARQLNRGKDVFNVKIGNKVTCSGSGLKNKSSPTHEGKSRVQFPTILRPTDKGKTRHGSKGRFSKIDRVRRKISRFPKDFDQRFMNTLNRESLLNHGACDSDELSESELKERDAIRRQIEQSIRHTRELANMKKQIALKRKLNKRVKSLRKVMTKANESTPFYCKETTSSFSGRTRKPNKRYSQEGFVMTQHEINYFLAEHKQKGIMKKEMKLFEERHKKDTRKLAQETFAQKRPAIDLVIDNPEMSEVHAFSVPNVKASNQESKPTTKRTKPSKKKGGHSKNRNGSLRDSVLIRDLPSDDHVIRGMLMSSTLDTISDSNYISNAISESQNTVETHPKSENVQITDDALLKDKFAKLKIPKSVQRLFRNRQNEEELVESKTTVPSANIGERSSVNASNTLVIQNSNTNSKAALLAQLSGSDKLALKQDRLHTEIREDVSVKQTSTKGLKGLTGLTLVKTIDSDGATIFKAFNGKGCVSFKPKDISAVSTQALPIAKPPTSVQKQSHMSIAATRTTGVLPMVPRPSLQFPGAPYPKVLVANGQQVVRNSSPRISLLQNPRQLAPINAQTQQVANVVNVINSAQGQIRSHTVPIIRARPPAAVTEAKSKFYLLNVEGKNILVPINPNPSEPPRAYLIGNSLSGSSLTPANATSQQPNFNVSTPSVLTPICSKSVVSNILTHTFVQTRPMTSIVRSKAGVTSGTGLTELSSAVASKVNESSAPDSVLSHSLSTVPTCLVSSPTTNIVTHMQGGENVMRMIIPEQSNVSHPPSDINSQCTPAIVKTEKIDEEFDKIENRGKALHAGNDKQSKITSDIPDTSVSFSFNGINDTQAAKQKETSGETEPPKADAVEPPKADAVEPPKAFADALSAREERRRRLKELIKEKNEALEAIRASSNKT